MVHIEKVKSTDLPRIVAWDRFLRQNFPSNGIDHVNVLKMLLEVTDLAETDHPHMVFVAESISDRPRLYGGASGDVIPYTTKSAIGRVAYAVAKQGIFGAATVARGSVDALAGDLQQYAEGIGLSMDRLIVESDADSIARYEGCGFRRLVREDGAPLSYIRPPLHWTQEGTPEDPAWTQLTLMMRADKQGHRKLSPNGYPLIIKALFDFYTPDQIEMDWDDNAYQDILGEINRCKNFFLESAQGKYLVMEEKTGSSDTQSEFTL